MPQRVAGLVLALLALWGAVHADAAIVRNREANRAQIASSESNPSGVWVPPATGGRDLVRPPQRLACPFQHAAPTSGLLDTNRIRHLVCSRTIESRGTTPHRLLMRHRPRVQPSDNPAA